MNFELIYDLHLDQLRAAMKAAIRAAMEKHSDIPQDEFYIVGVACDGQYAEITVGVSNVTDYHITINADALPTEPAFPAGIERFLDSLATQLEELSIRVRDDAGATFELSENVRKVLRRAKEGLV